KAQVPTKNEEHKDAAAEVKRNSAKNDAAKGVREPELGFKKIEDSGKELTLDLGGGVKMEFVRIPKGRFTMGSPNDEKDKERNEDDEQLHEVEITRDYYLGKYPVTQEQYEKVMGSNPSHFSKNGKVQASIAGLETSRFPVEMISWFAAVRYCEKL